MVSGAPGTGKSTAERVGELAATVAPLRLGAALVEVDTGPPGGSDLAVAAIRAALN